MSSIDFTAQFLVYKLPSERRTSGLVLAILLMIFLMIWGFTQGVFLCVLILAPIMYTGTIWRKRNSPTEVRELEANISVADDVLRVFVKNSFLSRDGTRYIDHCYLCAREDLQSIEIDETNMFTFDARFIRAFALEGNDVVEQSDDSNHTFTFRVSDDEAQRLESFFAANGFSVMHVSDDEMGH